MNIVIVICEEDGSFDLDSLLGHIAFTDGFQSVKVKDTYIDSWFDALIRGLQAVRLGSPCVIDLVDEPDSLVFRIENRELLIRYGDVVIRCDSIDTFARTLRSAALIFLDIISAESGNVSSEMLQSIAKFVSSEDNSL